MRKLDGLRFLLDRFPDRTVDCRFFPSLRGVPRSYDGAGTSRGAVWHARTGRRVGSELATPVRRCATVEALHAFGNEVFGMYADAELVVHRVPPSFYTPVYVGSIAVYHRPAPVATIEFQAMTTWHGTNAPGARPRDWPSVARFIYPFLSRRPTQVEGSAAATIGRTHRLALAELWTVADSIADHTTRRRHGRSDDTITRFNVYGSGRVLLDDHRSVRAFSWS